MSQNTSSAVMQQRAEPHDSLDFFPTPPWATRALMEHVIIPQLGLLGRKELRGMTCWEPACGPGAIVRLLRSMAQAMEDCTAEVELLQLTKHSDISEEHTVTVTMKGVFKGVVELTPLPQLQH